MTVRSWSATVGPMWTAQGMRIGLSSCGWGYAEPNELVEHGAYRVIDHVDELSGAVEEYFAGKATA